MMEYLQVGFRGKKEEINLPVLGRERSRYGWREIKVSGRQLMLRKEKRKRLPGFFFGKKGFPPRHGACGK